DASAAIRSVGGAGAPRQAAPRVAGTPSPAPARAPLSSQQRYTQYVQDVERYQSSAAHSRLSRLQQQHEQAVKQYGIDPELRRYEQRLTAYNAQLAAHQQAVARGRGVPATAERLRSMQQTLEGQRTSIMSRKNQELAGIRVLEANIGMMGAPLQGEYRRLKAEEQALTAAAAPQQLTGGSGGGSGGRGGSAPQTGSLTSLGFFGFAEQQKRAADAELRKIGGEGKPPSLPAWTPVQDTFFQGLYSHPVLKTVQMGPAGLAGEMAASHLVNRNLAQERAEVMTGFVRGEYEGLREDPKTAIGSFALGLVVPGVGKAVPWVGRTAAKVVGPKVAAAAAPYLPKIGKAAGIGLTGIYGGSVGVRLLEPDEQGFSPTAPLIAERAGRITSTEILPAAAGWGLASRGAAPLLKSATSTLKKAGTTLKNAGRSSRSGVQSVTRPQAPEWTRTLDLSSPSPDRVVQTPQTPLLPERAGPVRGVPASPLEPRALPASSVRTGSPSSPWGSYDDYYQNRLSDLLAERGVSPRSSVIPDDAIQAARSYAGTRVRIDTEVDAALQSGTPYSGTRRGSRGRGTVTPPKTGNAYIDTAVSRSASRRTGGPSVVEPSPWDNYDYYYQKRLDELLAERGISPGSLVIPDDAVQAARAYAGDRVLIDTEVSAAMRAGAPVKGSPKAPSRGAQTPPKTGNAYIDTAVSRRSGAPSVVEPSPWDSYNYYYQKRLEELLAERGISPGSLVIPDDAVQAARAYAGNQVLVDTEVAAAMRAGSPVKGSRKAPSKGAQAPPKTGNAYIDTAVSRRSGGSSVLEPSPWDSYDSHYQKRLEELLAERGISPGSLVIPDDAIQAARAYARGQVLIDTEVSAAMRSGTPLRGTPKAPSKGSQAPPKTGNAYIDMAVSRSASRRSGGSSVLEPSPWDNYDYYYQKRLDDLLAERGISPGSLVTPDDAIQAARGYAGDQVLIDTEVTAAMRAGAPVKGSRKAPSKGSQAPPKTGNAYIDTAVSRRSGGSSVLEPSPWDSYDSHYQKRLEELLAERGISPGSSVIPDDAIQAARAYAGNQVLIDTEVSAAMRSGSPVYTPRSATGGVQGVPPSLPRPAPGRRIAAPTPPASLPVNARFPALAERAGPSGPPWVSSVRPVIDVRNLIPPSRGVEVDDL
ncbi:MAG: hypothetical protein WC277_09465, partial [Bacilli bacterium]